MTDSCLSGFLSALRNKTVTAGTILAFTATGLPARFTVEDARLSQSQAADGDVITLEYRINTQEAVTVLLHANIHRGIDYLFDRPNDKTVALSEGTHWYSRDFRINYPPRIEAGRTFNLHALAREVDGDFQSAVLRTDAINLLQPAPLAIPILSYNKIGPEMHNWFWISTEIFREHMHALSEAGYVTLTLDQVMKIRAGRMQAPEKAVALTFLNGYRLHKEIVDPILDEFGFVATNFIPPHHIGKTNAWDDGDNDPEIPHLTWDEIREMEASGRWDFQATGHEHVDIQFVDTRTEARLAREAIREELGKEVRFFSYPYGVGAEDVNNHFALYRENYFAAFGFRGGYVSLDDKWAFPRFDMHLGIHTDPYAYPAEWYLFGPHYLGSGTAMPKPHFEAYPDDGSHPGTTPQPPDDNPPGDDPPPAAPEFVHHPADTDQSGSIALAEVIAYGSAWREGSSWEHGPNPPTLAYVINAGAIWRNGGAYTYVSENDGEAAWQPESQ